MMIFNDGNVSYSATLLGNILLAGPLLDTNLFKSDRFQKGREEP